MALGQDTSSGGGVMSTPSVPGLGQDQWALMSGMNPGHPLVGGYAGSAGYLGGQRTVATSMPDATSGVATGSPASQNWKELFNLKGNPIGWVLILLLAYLTLTHLHVNASVGYNGRRK